MALDKEKIKANYSTDKHNVLGDFYIPALNNATSYDRAVGYFSSNALLYIIQGLDGLIKNNGKMRLIVGSPLTQDEYDSINSLETQDKIFNQIGSQWNILVNKELSELKRYRLEVFSWLIKTNKLEIKFALRKPGAIFHKKIGVISGEDFTVVFNGSLNETESALDNNSENFNVFRSWKEESFKDYGEYHIEEFDSVWEGNENGTITFDIPSRYYDDVKNYWSSEGPPSSELEKEAAKKIAEMFKNKEKQLQEPEYDFIKPKIPKTIDGHKYQIRGHQVSALVKWQKNNYNGIMALATGSGKTITAIHGAVKTATAEDNRIVLIVAVPYKILADQWCDVLELFNIKAVRCYDSSKTWRGKLINEIGNFRARLSNDFFAVVVVNATLATEGFLSLIDQIPEQNRFFIGDECHHHGGENAIEKLPEAKYKIGLSATPWSSAEIEQKERLEKYYGPIVASYTMKEALDDGVLTGYKYLLYPVRMNSEEGELYEKLTKSIVGLLNKKNRTPVDDQMLTNIVFKRSRLLDSLEDKFITLDNILKDKPVSKYTLFYCGSGASAISEYGLDNAYEDKGESEDSDRTKSIDRVIKILHNRNWNASKFTANESPKARIGILNNFKSGSIDAMAAIKVLDEGFDVPMCKEAFITASSRNERQFVQRRGRILRKFPGKKEAIIHDFVIVPDSHDQIYKTLIENELKRVREFYSVANNKINIYGEVMKIIDSYDLDFDLNEENENE